MPMVRLPKLTPPGACRKTLRDGGKARDAASDITSHTLSLIGVNYNLAATRPSRASSGPIRYVFQQATGIVLPRKREQARVGETVAIDNRPGDVSSTPVASSFHRVCIWRQPLHYAPSRGGAVDPPA